MQHTLGKLCALHTALWYTQQLAQQNDQPQGKGWHVRTSKKPWASSTNFMQKPAFHFQIQPQHDATKHKQAVALSMHDVLRIQHLRLGGKPCARACKASDARLATVPQQRARPPTVHNPPLPTASQLSACHRWETNPQQLPRCSGQPTCQ